MISPDGSRRAAFERFTALPGRQPLHHHSTIITPFITIQCPGNVQRNG
jgi:hypothetical protein